MDFAQYAKARDAYYSIALPTHEDFARYTKAFFDWIDAANTRVRAKWPELFKLREPLFDNENNNRKTKEA